MLNVASTNVDNVFNIFDNIFAYYYQRFKCIFIYSDIMC